MKEARFPEEFLWGTATAAYQIEGAVHEDGRGESIWDRFSHTPGRTFLGHTGDRACDHYHRYRGDVALMRELGLRSYRFSIAWPRVLPSGKGPVNEAGLDFYERLVDELLAAGIVPMTTLYHWDLPQALQDRGGWQSRDTPRYFADYAEVVFRRLADRVKLWITHNEPWVAAFLGHATGEHAPGITDERAAVQVSHHLLLSHAEALRAFEEHRSSGGSIGITLVLFPCHPASDRQGDQEAARAADGHFNRWFLDPVLTGNYPVDMTERYARLGRAPEIRPEDAESIRRGSVDFLGINYYFRRILRAPRSRDRLFEEVPPEGRDTRFTAMGWEIYPEGLYETLLRVHREYRSLPLYVTENGAAFEDRVGDEGRVEDEDRVRFLREHFGQAARAMAEGVDLRGYQVWSLYDNFEWAYGFDRRFGIVRVDFETLARTWKRSALWYRKVIAGNGF
jgi:beta-glucosidase